jgi:hypothetical protein
MNFKKYRAIGLFIIMLAACAGPSSETGDETLSAPDFTLPNALERTMYVEVDELVSHIERELP